MSERVEIELELSTETWELLDKMAAERNCSRDEVIDEILSAALDAFEAENPTE